MVLDQYTEAEWDEISSAAPLAELDGNEMYNLHRYWLWMSYQRENHDWLLKTETPDETDPLRTRRSASMYLWYSLLSSLIEGLVCRGVVFNGEMASDVEYLGDRLRRCRNATFHVPKKGQWDDRLFEIMLDTKVGESEAGPDKESVPRIRRLTSGLGRLFVEEPGRRRLVRLD